MSSEVWQTVTGGLVHLAVGATPEGLDDQLSDACRNSPHGERREGVGGPVEVVLLEVLH